MHLINKTERHFYKSATEPEHEESKSLGRRGQRIQLKKDEFIRNGKRRRTVKKNKTGK